MPISYRSAAVCIALLAAISPQSPAQPQCGWKPVSPEAVSGHAMAYDAARHQMVIFGGKSGGGASDPRDMGTVIWDGAHWDVRQPATFPSARVGHAMCYDSARQVILLQGGVSGSTRRRDTWTWNGASWQRVAENAPDLAAGASMAFDSSRGVAVLCGTTADNAQFQTWEWNGAAWSLRTTTGIPIGSSTALVYDSIRAVCVLRQNSNTYEWNGSTWTLRDSTGPASRSGTAMAFDSARGVTVLFGGYVNAERQDTWEWDGSVWTQRANAGPNRRANHAIAFDSDRNVVVMFGGYRSAGPATSTLTSDMWDWDGTTWVRRTDGIPEPNNHGEMVFDSARNVAVLVRPASESETDSPRRAQTWEWDGEFWHRRFTSSSPPSDTELRMTFDTVRQQTLLYAEDFLELWAFDGVDWTLLHDGTTGASPGFGSTYTAPMAFDSDHDIAITGYSGAWWGWDGTGWTIRSDTAFTARYACMAFDQARHVIVLYGWGNNIGRTFEWDGTTWLSRATGGPSAWKSCALAYDAERAVSVLFGGWDLTPFNRYWNEVWEWDGNAWTPRMASGPAPRGEAAMAYDSVRHRTIVFGGWAGANTFGDTWEWDGIAPAAIRTQPQPLFAPLGTTANFTVAAWGSDPITYQWRRNGVPLSDGQNPSGTTISGSNSPTLRIDPVGTADVGAYDLVATNECGETTSATAYLTVTRSDCAGDLDGNNSVELPDLAILLSQFGCNTAETGCTADIDVDGSVGLSDLAILLATFGTPCP